MKFSLIICTYMRPGPLHKLLESVRIQTRYPDQIIVVDGSLNDETGLMLQQNIFKNLHYFLVDSADRGLTRQRNFGIKQVSTDIEIVCFLDDDTVLEADYFEKLIDTYAIYPKALAVGGYISNEVVWQKVTTDYKPLASEFLFDGWKRGDGSRFVIRKKVGLDSDQKPGFVPQFSHGRSVGFLPPSGQTYEVEQLMGGVSSFRKSVFEDFQFSTYFEGYGLYEDADFCLRLAKTGKLYVNTSARLGHYHASSGRPNQYQYGKMVVRNGWYVWRVKNPQPAMIDRFKWHAITILLLLIRYTNVITTSKRKDALTEAFGRTVGWLSLFLQPPARGRSN